MRDALAPGSGHALGPARTAHSAFCKAFATQFPERPEFKSDTNHPLSSLNSGRPVHKSAGLNSWDAPRRGVAKSASKRKQCRAASSKVAAMTSPSALRFRTTVCFAISTASTQSVAPRSADACKHTSGEEKPSATGATRRCGPKDVRTSGSCGGDGGCRRAPKTKRAPPKDAMEISSNSHLSSKPSSSSDRSPSWNVLRSAASTTLSKSPASLPNMLLEETVFSWQRLLSIGRASPARCCNAPIAPARKSPWK
mmetsp:Transcript_47206/g.119504  ORF Transcript_47206/g.119504 Transcript_47206/m.119504 type:complete len:253 (-) Transcript_47206:269-1027(-)